MERAHPGNPCQLCLQDTTPDVCSRVLEAVFDSNLIPIMTRMCIDGKLLSSSSSGREWLTGPRGGEYYLTEWGTKVYRNHK